MFVGFSLGVLWVPLTSEKYGSRWTGYAKMLLSVDACTNVCTWCNAMDLHPIQSVHVSTHCDQNKVWIQRNTYQDIAVNE